MVRRAILITTLSVNFLFFGLGFADFRELYQKGEFERALVELEQSAEGQEKGYSYFYNKGIIHHALKQDGLAVAHLLKAQSLFPGAEEVEEPLRAAYEGLAKELGSSRLDPTSTLLESLGEKWPLDLLFFSSAALGLLLGGMAILQKRKGRRLRFFFVALISSFLFGTWAIWLDQHPLIVLTTNVTARSGPGSTYIDRAWVHTGMKLRLVGEMQGEGGLWWKVRINEQLDLGFIPASSGLLLSSESNKPE